MYVVTIATNECLHIYHNNKCDARAYNSGGEHTSRMKRMPKTVSFILLFRLISARCGSHDNDRDNRYVLILLFNNIIIIVKYSNLLPTFYPTDPNVHAHVHILIHSV